MGIRHLYICNLNESLYVFLIFSDKKIFLLMFAWKIPKNLCMIQSIVIYKILNVNIAYAKFASFHFEVKVTSCENIVKLNFYFNLFIHKFILFYSTCKI